MQLFEVGFVLLGIDDRAIVEEPAAQAGHEQRHAEVTHGKFAVELKFHAFILPYFAFVRNWGIG